MVALDRPHMRAIIWLMLYACCIPKAADAHSEYVIVIGFPRQQWLHERVPLLRYTYSVLLKWNFESDKSKGRLTRRNVYLIINVAHLNMLEQESVYWGKRILWQPKNKNQLDATYYFIVCTSYRLNMFRVLLCPSSGARDCNVDYHIGCFVLGLL